MERGYGCDLWGYARPGLMQFFQGPSRWFESHSPVCPCFDLQIRAGWSIRGLRESQAHEFYVVYPHAMLRLVSWLARVPSAGREHDCAATALASPGQIIFMTR